MKKSLFFVLLTIMSCGLMNVFAVPQQVNYQGQLTDPSDAPLDTVVNITFKIYNAPTGGEELWSETQTFVEVLNGLFDVQLGSVTYLPDLFEEDRWLGVTVGEDEEMEPREEIISVAYAYRVGTVDGASGGTITGTVYVTGYFRCLDMDIDNGIHFHDGTYQTTGFDSTSLSNRINLKADSADIARRTWVKSLGYLRGANNFISATGFIGGGDNNKARGDYSVIGGGGGATPSDSNSATGTASTISGGSLNKASGDRATVSGGNNNKASSDYTTVCGGFSNTASANSATVSGGTGNKATSRNATVSGGDLDSASGSWATVSGGHLNTASGFHATVSGGRENRASGDSATVCGGANNSAIGDQAVVSGGFNNSAAGELSVVSGGGANTASGWRATVSGGAVNQASGTESSVGGGETNTASGLRATVPGGLGNVAAGDYSFAAGRNASALAIGSFAWGSSSTGSPTTAFNNYHFTVRCENGARFYTHPSNNTGVQLMPGGGSWSSLSDSTQKEKRKDVNTSEVLDKLNQLKISEWNYKSQDAKIRHMGPMAQDFSAAFRLGENNTTITTVDVDGVMMAAIQELAKENSKLQTSNSKLEAEIAALRSAVQTLQAEQKQTNNRVN